MLLSQPWNTSRHVQGTVLDIIDMTTRLDGMDVPSTLDEVSGTFWQAENGVCPTVSGTRRACNWEFPSPITVCFHGTVLLHPPVRVKSVRGYLKDNYDSSSTVGRDSALVSVGMILFSNPTLAPLRTSLQYLAILVGFSTDYLASRFDRSASRFRPILLGSWR